MEEDYEDSNLTEQLGESEANLAETYDGSRPLKKARWERFARRVASGQRPALAYKASGFSCKDDHVAGVNASRLMAHDRVGARVRFLSHEHEREKLAAIEAIAQGDISSAAGRVKMLVESIEEINVRLREIKLIWRARANFDDTPAGANLPELPGMQSGHIIAGWKTVAKRAVRTHEFDVATLREWRELHEGRARLGNLIAIELGQRKDNLEVVSRYDSPADIPLATLKRWRDELDKEAAAKPN